MQGSAHCLLRQISEGARPTSTKFLHQTSSIQVCCLNDVFRLDDLSLSFRFAILSMGSTLNYKKLILFRDFSVKC